MANSELFSVYSFDLNDNGTIGLFPLGYYKFRIIDGEGSSFVEIEIIGKSIKSIFSRSGIPNNKQISVYRKFKEEDESSMYLATNITSGKIYLIENSKPISTNDLVTINNDNSNLVVTLNFGDGFYEQPIASDNSQNKSYLETNGLSKVGNAKIVLGSNKKILFSDTKIFTDFIEKGDIRVQNIKYSDSPIKVNINNNDAIFHFIKESTTGKNADIITINNNENITGVIINKDTINLS